MEKITDTFRADINDIKEVNTFVTSIFDTSKNVLDLFDEIVNKYAIDSKAYYAFYLLGVLVGRDNEKKDQKIIARIKRKK